MNACQRIHPRIDCSPAFAKSVIKTSEFSDRPSQWSIDFPILWVLHKVSSSEGNGSGLASIIIQTFPRNVLGSSFPFFSLKTAILGTSTSGKRAVFCKIIVKDAVDHNPVSGSKKELDSGSSGKAGEDRTRL